MQVWDLVTSKPGGTALRHEHDVQSAHLSPDGRQVLTASEDETACLWDAANGKPTGESLNNKEVVNSAQFSPNGNRIVTASADKTPHLWDATSGKPVGEPMRHEGIVNSAQFSPNSQLVVTALRGKTARLWDANSGKSLGEFMKHEGMVNSAHFSPDGQRVVTASWDKTARVRDTMIVTDKDTEADVLLLAELAEATAGVTLETVEQAENVKLLAPEQVVTSWKIAAKFSGPASKLTPLQQFMEWSVSGRRGRTISPFSQVTVSEWLENRIKEETVEGLRSALQIDPANARVTAYLGWCLADEALKQNTDPDEARRLRGEASFLTERAQKLAPDSDEVKKLRDQVVKLAGIKTN